jgi:hypothetical protein
LLNAAMRCTPSLPEHAGGQLAAAREGIESDVGFAVEQGVEALVIVPARHHDDPPQQRVEGGRRHQQLLGRDPLRRERGLRHAPLVLLRRHAPRQVGAREQQAEDICPSAPRAAARRDH